MGGLPAAPVAPGLVSRYECRIAGVRLTTNRIVAGDNEDLLGPASSEVLFASAQEETTSDWLSILNPATRTEVRIRRDGRRAVVAPELANPDERAREMRWALPFIAALQRETILHASAVERVGCVYGFVAESRTGKSTFSSALARRGWNKVADDLLPQCLVEQGNRRLRALFFLQRPAAEERIAARRLDAEEALAELVSNGFGELANGAIWETHFRYYCRILESVSCYEFTVPDCLERLDEAASWWERTVEAEGLR
jgi:hypothetical protein